MRFETKTTEIVNAHSTIWSNKFTYMDMQTYKHQKPKHQFVVKVEAAKDSIHKTILTYDKHGSVNVITK